MSRNKGNQRKTRRASSRGANPLTSVRPRNAQTEATPFPPDPVIEAYNRDVDRTLLRENLKLAHEQRLLKLMAMRTFVQEISRAKRTYDGKA